MKPPKDQHFLVDRQAVERIAGCIEVAGRRVLEVGPGGGILTRALLDRGAIVIAVELDAGLVSDLSERFAEEIREGRLYLIHGDATKCDIPAFDVVVANLPYSASSKIVFRLLETGFEEAVLMFQKEFADRMMAVPGTPGCGRLSVMVQTYARVEPVLELSQAAFSPRPAVRSWVVRITPAQPPYPILDRKVYADLVRVLFSHRRKTVLNGLRGAYGVFRTVPLERCSNSSSERAGVSGKERVDAAISRLPDEILKSRPERLSLEAFARIANVISDV